ncbi:hypothetical protein CE91St30_04080 [Raoultibacter timonensis]|uniref:Uncharacterized protein n=1 Tax=Raoultibacter timonensis TaxID=1907662 RepID=A0ABM7WG23_9ACTN|nr:hypothetical protein CE91St30_04080 [Raoultibacter timonensis]BDF49678.1 hypothetical protein CE91St31_04080 [Raoultibacter timonensis]
MMTLRFFTFPVITVIKMPTVYRISAVVASSAPIITGTGMFDFSSLLDMQAQRSCLRDEALYPHDVTSWQG